MKQSFIHKVNRQNLSNVEQDLKAHSENVVSFYVVDTFDIIETCFPSLYTSDKKSNKNLEIAIYLASQHLFFESENQPVILDEYKVEIFSFWANLRKNLVESYKKGKKEKILNLIEKYKSLNFPYEISRFVEGEIGLLLSISINTLGVSPVQRFNQLINGRLQINKFICQNTDDTLFINTVFRKTDSDNDRILEIYKKFVNYNRYHLNSKPKEEIYVYLENSLRDIKVFDRILAINEQLEKEYKSGKLKQQYRLLYLSSAPQKSTVIQELYRDLNQSEIQDSKFGFQTSVNIHRSNVDIHLFDLIKSSHKKNDSYIDVKLTDELSNLVENDGYESFKFDTTVSIDDRDKQDLFDYSKLESLFYINKTIRGHLNDVKKTLGKLKSKNKNTEKTDSELSKIFEKCLEFLDNENLDKNIEQIKTIVESHNETILADIDIQKTLQNSILRGKSLSYRIHSSVDSVKSIIQSYPVLLFYNIEGKENLHHSVEEIFTKFIMYSDSRSLHISYKPNSVGIYTGLYLELYSLFLLLLLDSETRLSEEGILSRLSALEIKASSVLKSELTKENGKEKYNVEVDADHKLQAEIKYFYLWCLRRLERYDEGMSLAVMSYESYSDPRFIQGKALCLKSKYYSEKKTASVAELTNYLEDALNSLTKAEKLFSNIKVENDFLLEHTKIAISNSICDTYIQLVSINKPDDSKFNQPIIQEAKKRIETISNRLKELDGSIEKHPAYCHTACEVYLESTRLDLLGSNILSAQDHYEIAREFFILIQDKEHLESYSELPETTKKFNKIGKKLHSKTK